MIKIGEEDRDIFSQLQLNNEIHIKLMERLITKVDWMLFGIYAVAVGVWFN